MKWQTGSPARRDSGISMPGSRLTELTSFVMHSRPSGQLALFNRPLNWIFLLESSVNVFFSNWNVLNSFHSLTLFVNEVHLDLYQPLLSLRGLWLVAFLWAASRTSLAGSSLCSSVASCAACLILFQLSLLLSGCLLSSAQSLVSWLVRRGNFFLYNHLQYKKKNFLPVDALRLPVEIK